MFPEYIAKAVPRQPALRKPWYANTAPTYAGVFLWIGFYESIANGTLNRAGLPLSLLGLVLAALLSYGLFYYAPAMLGMKTGLPLYVVGSSTFGATGGYLIPGLLMGALQVGWFGVSANLASAFLLRALGLPLTPGTLPVIVVNVIWGFIIAAIAAMGINYVARVALLVNVIPLFMILTVFFKTNSGFTNYTATDASPWVGFTLLVQIVTGFFATAGAAGADFGMENRGRRDVRLGGLVGIGGAILFAGGLPLIAMAGAHATHPALVSYDFDALIGVVGGTLSRTIFVLYAFASIPGACFCAFIMGNSFSTMLPRLGRTSVILAGCSVAIVMSCTGVSSHLVPFFQIIGASFGPVCGAMLADYLVSGRRWAGPREGINIPGYAAWLGGFLVGIIPFLPGSQQWKAYFEPAAVYSAVAGFLIYWILSKAGLDSKPLSA